MYTQRAVLFLFNHIETSEIDFFFSDKIFMFVVASTEADKNFIMLNRKAFNIKVGEMMVMHQTRKKML